MFLLLKEKLAASIAAAAGVPIEEAGRSIELPKGQFGDIASSICFSLAKKERKNPVELAKSVVARMKLPEWVEKAEVAGPYINFTLSGAFYSGLLEAVTKQKGKFGAGKRKTGKTIIEFPSVNPNKPWHIGHLRNALLGDSVARMLEFSGFEVLRADYIDDLGLQVAQSYWGYRNLGSKPEGKLDLWLGKQYVEASRKFEEDAKVQEAVRKLLKEMEEGKSADAKQCRALVEKCVAAQYETAFKFSVYHDVLIFESDIVRTIFAEGLEMLRKNGAIVHEKEGKNAGCWVARMSGAEFAAMESPDKILIRSDGTATYTGKDVIFQLWKFGLLKNDFSYAKFIRQPNGNECKMSSAKGIASQAGFGASAQKTGDHWAPGETGEAAASARKKGAMGHATRAVNVIGMEQAYPQKVIAEILGGMGYGKEAENSVHLSYEHVWLADEKFSGRQGTWIGYTADELYGEGVKRAEAKIKPEVMGPERAKIAASIAAGAIRFAFLKTTPEKKIIFAWDTALSLEGDSAPYVIYAHARAHKILEKGGVGKLHGAALEPAEKELLKKIMVFGAVVQEAALHMRPHMVAEYCVELATLYNRFYNACPILSCGDEKARQNRLAINFAALTAMKNSLGAIGIDALERM